MAIQRLAEAIDQVVTGYPMGDGGDEPMSTITITGPDGTEHRIPRIDAEQLTWLSELIERGYTDLERSYRDDPRHGVCAHCGPEGDDLEAAEYAGP